MTKTTQKTQRSVLGGILVALSFLAVSVLAFSAYADVRGGTVERDRGTTGRTIEPTPPSTGSGQATPTPPPSPSGGITSSTDGSVNTGGNTGGNVTTGDEHVDVHEVNIGPTNPPPPPPEVAPVPTPEPECDRRSAGGCPTQDVGRTR